MRMGFGTTKQKPFISASGFPLRDGVTYLPTSLAMPGSTGSIAIWMTERLAVSRSFTNEDLEGVHSPLTYRFSHDEYARVEGFHPTQTASPAVPTGAIPFEAIPSPLNVPVL